MSVKKQVSKKPTEMEVGDYFYGSGGMCVVKSHDKTFLHDHKYAKVLRLALTYDGSYSLDADYLYYYEHEPYKYIVEGNIRRKKCNLD